MAYGTETVPKCDVIVGPGNAYVNTAKKLVYGEVGIDMLAGPSEVAVVADEGANPAFVAADLLAQTEHGQENKGVLFSHSSDMLEKCKNELAQSAGIAVAERDTGRDREQLDFCQNELSGRVAGPVQCPRAGASGTDGARAAGCPAPGPRTPGRSCSATTPPRPSATTGQGPSHTLPTAGAARFSSPLSVATFMKRTSVLYYSQKAAQEAAEDVARLRRGRGLRRPRGRRRG